MDKPAVSWQVLSPAGPAVAYHVAAVIKGHMYIHGGIDKKASTTPLNKLHRLDLNTFIWHEVHVDGSPALSHHAAVVFQDRYLVIVGGWDGKVRTSKMFIFDTAENCWSFPDTTGFEDGAGLSSHTAGLLESGDIIIMGREGSTKYHRRSGGAWLLHGSISKGFVYKGLGFATASRSGHTMHSFGSNLFVLGGRSDQLVETQAGYRCVPPPYCSVLHKLSSIINSLPQTKKPPCGRKSHVAVAGGKVILIHGGETFDGKCREPVAETFALTVKPHIQWYQLPNSPRGRQGHTLVCTPDKVIIHGGLGPKGHVASDSYELCVS